MASIARAIAESILFIIISPVPTTEAKRSLFQMVQWDQLTAVSAGTPSPEGNTLLGTLSLPLVVRDSSGICTRRRRRILTTAKERKRPRYLLSGLTRCGECGGYPMVSAGCSTARNKGTCSNRTNIRRDVLERRVLDALRHHLMEPALFAEFCDEFTREMNRIRLAGRQPIEAAQAEITKSDRDLDMLVDMILRGGAAERLNAKMLVIELRKRQLEARLEQATEPPPLLHPEMACQVESLHEFLRDGSPAERHAATAGRFEKAVVLNAEI